MIIGSDKLSMYSEMTYVERLQSFFFVWGQGGRLFLLFSAGWGKRIAEDVEAGYRALGAPT
jgi:hypothetical protein